MTSEVSSFSLVAGGPLFRLLRRTGLAGAEMEFLIRRAVVFSSVAWIPLAVLCLLDGRAVGVAVRIPFFSDVELQARLLLAVPLFLLAEVVAFGRMAPVLPEFLRRGIVLDSDRPRFDAAVASARRLRDSAFVEILLLGVVYFFGVGYLWRRHGSLPLSTWFGTPEPDGHRLTAAGWWYALVALPLVQFLILRWYFRVLIWARLLWKISRLDLQLVPTHPDRCGGLGFLAAGLRAFSTLLLAQGVLVAGAIANRIFFNGARLVDFKMELAVFTVVVLLFLLGPTLAFSPRLTHAKRKGVREYGAFAEKYVRAFDRKWLRGAPSEERLGSADVQSLADLGNSYEMVRRMQALPFSRSVVVELASAALVPVAPLLLTMMPLETLLEHVMKMIF